MWLWVSISILTVIILSLLAFPFLRREKSDARTAADYDMALYKSQIREVDREAGTGVFSPQEAEVAKAEIARRLLAADSQGIAKAPEEIRSRVTQPSIAIMLLLVLTAGSLALYLQLGNPTLPARPLAERAGEKEQMIAENRAADGIGDMISVLEQRLQTEPESLDGWMLLGRSYLSIGDIPAALTAYEQAVALDRTAPGVLSAYGEALVMQAQGAVLAPAMTVFQEAVMLETRDMRARFYLAQGDYQAGRPKEALQAYLKLIADGPADAPWLPMVREAALAVSSELGVALPKQLARAAEQSSESIPSGLDAQDLAVASGMSAAERAEMIETMVANLAARLADEPANLQGWLRLGQSYLVLKKYDLAGNAFARAAALQPENPEILLLQGRALRGEGATEKRPQIRKLMDQVLSIQPDNLEALWMIAIDEADQGRLDAAASYFDLALNHISEKTEDYMQLRAEADAILSRMK